MVAFGQLLPTALWKLFLYMNVYFLVGLLHTPPHLLLPAHTEWPHAALFAHAASIDPPEAPCIECTVGRRGARTIKRYTDSGALPSGYAYGEMEWYTDLKASPPFRILRQSDFVSGTVRITVGGRYQLGEDILFAPNAELSSKKDRFWPPVHSPSYPMGQFYLGFFAAITIETSNVWLDLNGFSITMRDDFYLRQRWFSVVELADRPFVASEGVASLNFQEGDRLLSHPLAANPEADGLGSSSSSSSSSGANRFGPRGAPLAAASHTIISGGRLGQTSHAGIHGNGNHDVVVEDVAVTDFEVAGIQFNGGDNIAVVRSTVGPSKASDVPSHRVSHAVFTTLYAQRYLPGGLFHLAAKGHKGLPIAGGSLNPTLAGTIQLGDRPRGEEVQMQWLFDRLEYALDLYFDHELGTSSTEVDAQYGVTTEDAVRFFGNPTGLSDGSALYGLVFHRVGAAVDGFGAQDEPFTGPEHENITVRDVAITGLRHHTVTVPALVFADGTRIQGPVRDVIELTDMVSNLISPALGRYQGNLLSDAYLAFWKLSNVFYKAFILDSPCGNFGSNLTSNYADCDGQVVNKGLTGRDIILLQKKYFGGVSMSSAFYEWATTPGAKFSSLIGRNPDVFGRRQGRHYISCGGDTMFHTNKGVVGIRMEFIQNVQVKNVSVHDAVNTADAGHWLCGEQYRLPKTMELVKAQQMDASGDHGADVHGIAMAKVDGVGLTKVTISGLASLEGMVTGVSLAGDTNDRRNRTADPVFRQQVRLSNVAVTDLVAGSGRIAKPLSSDLTSVSTGGGSKFDGETEAHNQFDPPKVSLRHAVAGTTSAENVEDGSFMEAAFVPAFTVPPSTVLDKFNFSHAQMNAFVLEGLGFFESEYGIPLDGWRRVDEDVTSTDAADHPAGWVHAHDDEIDFADPDAWSWSERLVQADDHGISFFGVYRKPGQDFHTDVVCVKDSCAGPLTQSSVYNYVNAIMFGSTYLAKGVFGGPSGKLVYPEQILIHGAYLVENLPWSSFGLEDEEESSTDGRIQQQQQKKGHDTFITYYGTCPIDFPGTRTVTDQDDPSNNWVDVSVINCKLDGGPLLGKGWGVGTFMLEKKDGKYTISIVDNQVFDDSPIAAEFAPEARSVPTNNECEGGGQYPSPPVVLQVRVDGVLPSSPAHNGKEIWPLTKQYHHTHEAASKFFYERSKSVQTDAQFRDVRNKALLFFRDEMEIGTPVSTTANSNLQHAIDNGNSIALHNQIDLGGGAYIVPYATNDLLNQRAYTLSGASVPAEQLADGAIKEGGIMMVVGRAGIHSSRFGYLMQGTVIKYGLYVVSAVGKYGDVECWFADRKPMIPDLNGHYSIDQRLWSSSHADLANGKAQGLVSNFEVGGPNFDSKGVTPVRGAGTQHNTRFTMEFGTVAGVDAIESVADLDETCNVPCTDIDAATCTAFTSLCTSNSWVYENCGCTCKGVVLIIADNSEEGEDNEDETDTSEDGGSSSNENGEGGSSSSERGEGGSSSSENGEGGSVSSENGEGGSP